jgi:hypothetical protein
MPLNQAISPTGQVFYRILLSERLEDGDGDAYGDGNGNADGRPVK